VSVEFEQADPTVASTGSEAGIIVGPGVWLLGASTDKRIGLPQYGNPRELLKILKSRIMSSNGKNAR